MVAVLAVEDIDVQGDSGVEGECPQEFLDQFAVHLAQEFGFQLTVVDQERAV